MRGDEHLPHPFAAHDQTFPRMLLRQVERHGARPMFQCGDQSWSTADTVEIARMMAGRLAAAGIVQGDRVAILSTNRPEVMRLLVGVFWLGAVAVPVNAGSQAQQIQYCLGNSGAKLLVIEAALVERLEHCGFDALAVESIWIIGGDGDHMLPRPTFAFSGEGEPVEAGKMRPGDAMAVLYTSGTTGPAKGVMCPHAQFYWWGAHTSRYLEITSDDVLCTTLPLFHTNAINTFFQAMLTGARQVVIPKFSASSFWADMIAAQATVGYVLGAMVPILLAQPAGAAERSHKMRVALGPGVPDSLHGDFKARTGVALADGFGSTETNFVIGTTAARRSAGRIGWVAPGIDALVVDDCDVPVAAGVAGELVLRADAPFAFATGYFGMPEATAAATRNLWFHTGDRVIQYEDGSFAFVDRLKDSIRRRGENISSFEVEQVLASHSAIATVAVFAVPSPLAEDEVMAVMIAKPGLAIDFDELVQFCSERLPRFAVPRYFECVDDLPRTENGKVQKFKLKERGVTAATWDREGVAK